MSMNRRRTASYRRRRGKGKKGGVPPQLVILGVAGIVGLGWFAKGKVTGGAAQPLPLAANLPAGEAPARDQAAPGTNVFQIDDVVAGAPPAELSDAFAHLAGDDPMALIDLRRLAVEFAGTPDAARATTALENERQRCLQRVQELQGDAIAQLRHLTRAYLATLAPQPRRAMRDAISQLSQTVFVSGKLDHHTTSYTVQSGDVLSRIARQHGSDYRMIKRFNGLENDRIRVGQRLRVPTGQVQVVIFKRDFEVILLYEGDWLRAYDCATGKDDSTPEGEFTIGPGKLVNPDWYAPDGKVYPYGTEGNILGTRWLPFVNTPEHQGFGIHGTKFPNSIGTEASMGCIRLRNHDAEDIYDLVPPESKVRIVR